MAPPAPTPARRTFTTTIVRPLLPEEKMCWNLGFQWTKTLFESICSLEPKPTVRSGLSITVRTQSVLYNFLRC